MQGCLTRHCPLMLCSATTCGSRVIRCTRPRQACIMFFFMGDKVWSSQSTQPFRPGSVALRFLLLLPPPSVSPDANTVKASSKEPVPERHRPKSGMVAPNTSLLRSRTPVSSSPMIRPAPVGEFTTRFPLADAAMLGPPIPPVPLREAIEVIDNDRKRVRWNHSTFLTIPGLIPSGVIRCIGRSKGLPSVFSEDTTCDDEGRPDPESWLDVSGGGASAGAPGSFVHNPRTPSLEPTAMASLRLPKAAARSPSAPHAAASR
mmetsp:Transcript_11077/g.29328  ORF Transcript_11077/g.29328 Transcript_11077/m.29328 type:complete len:260 (+) Transcript_11077:186-965(+)